MTIHKCDRCGKEMEKWLNVSTTVGTEHSYVNVADLFPLYRTKEFCKECYLTIFENDDTVEESDEPYVITEDTYNTDRLNWGKKIIFVYNNVCTFPVVLRTIDDEEMEGYIGKDLLKTARDMTQEERMYVRNPKIETDVELIRGEIE